MSKDYPLISGSRRQPNADRDGGKEYGKPCIVCGIGTIGEKFVQISWFRGEDETVRVCADHWKLSDSVILKSMEDV